PARHRIARRLLALPGAAVAAARWRHLSARAAGAGRLGRGARAGRAAAAAARHRRRRGGRPRLGAGEAAVPPARDADALQPHLAARARRALPLGGARLVGRGVRRHRGRALPQPAVAARRPVPGARALPAAHAGAGVTAGFVLRWLALLVGAYLV